MSPVQRTRLARDRWSRASHSSSVVCVAWSPEAQRVDQDAGLRLASLPGVVDADDLVGDVEHLLVRQDQQVVVRPLVDVVVDQPRHDAPERVDLAQAAVHEAAGGAALPVDEVVVGLLAHRPDRRGRVGDDRPVAVVPDDAAEAVQEHEEAVRVVLQVEQHQLRGGLAGHVDLQAGQGGRQRARPEPAGPGGCAGSIVAGDRHHRVAVAGIGEQAHQRHAVSAGGRGRGRGAQRTGGTRVLDIHAARRVELHGDLCYKAVVGVQRRARRHDARRVGVLGGGEQGGQGERGRDGDANGGRRTHDREPDPMA